MIFHEFSMKIHDFVELLEMEMELQQEEATLRALQMQAPESAKVLGAGAPGFFDENL